MSRRRRAEKREVLPDPKEFTNNANVSRVIFGSTTAPVRPSRSAT